MFIKIQLCRGMDAAKLLGLKSPISYLWKDYAVNERLEYVMNFAYGGTRVFETINSNLNMTY